MNRTVTARRTGPDMPARSLTPRAVACDSPVQDEPAPRPLLRPLPARSLGRTEEGRR